MENSPLAVIDVGSNSIRCLIVKVKENKSLEVLEKDLKTTRLGKGLSESGKLEQDSVKKSLDTLKNYIELVDKYDAKLCRVIGTSALREAENARDFVDWVKYELGITIEVISSEEEADLTSKGALYDKKLESYLVFDLGGGSLELISQEPYFVKSIDVGAVKIMERLNDSRGLIDLQKLQLFVENELDKNFAVIREMLVDKKNFLVGVGGTATSLVMLYLSLEDYDASKIQDYYMTRDDILELIYSINNLSIGERKKLKGMPENREDIIVPGGGIIYSLLDYFSYEGYYASDKDLMCGMVYDYLFGR